MATQAGRKIVLSWNDVNGEKKYTIKWRDQSTKKWRTISRPANKTKYVQKGIKLGHTYEYRIQAVRPKAKGGNSPWSAIFTITPHK